jgi:hypothetical protein
MTPLWLLFGGAPGRTDRLRAPHHPRRDLLGGLGAGPAFPARLATGDSFRCGGVPVAEASARAGTLWLVHARVSVALGRSFEHCPTRRDAAAAREPRLLTWFLGMGPAT